MFREIELKIPSLALDSLKRVVHKRPYPQIHTEAARFTAHVIANHLIFLILTTSDANICGRHSVAISLFRHMEDALDCFGGVALIPGAGEKWTQGMLKPSEAARLYENKLGTIKLPTGETALDYRKNLRSHFNHYAHCTPYLTDWDLYPHFNRQHVKKFINGELKEGIKSELRVNSDARLLLQNAERIGSFLAAHTLEFSYLIEMGYGNFLNLHKTLHKELKENMNELEDALKKGIGVVYLEAPPPEIRNPRIQHPENPNLVMELNLPNIESKDT